MINIKPEKKKITAVITAAILIVLVTAVLFFVYDPLHQADEHYGYAMGSETVAVFYGGDNKDTADELFSEINTLDTKLLSAKAEDSEIALLNKNGSAQLSDEVLLISQ